MNSSRPETGVRIVQDRAKITFAIAVFNEIGPLKSALSRLRANGLVAGDFLILARPDALNGALLREWKSLRGNSHVMWSQWISVGERPGGRMIRVMSDDCSSDTEAKRSEVPPDYHEAGNEHSLPGKVGDAPRPWKRIMTLAANFHAWLMPQQTAHIKELIQSGNCALFIDVGPDDQLASVCHLLLRFAHEGVQTHQVSVAA